MSFGRTLLALFAALSALSLLSGSALGGINAIANTDSDGNTIIIIEGEFEPFQNLDPIFDAIKSNRPVLVSFDSPGGSIYAAMALGRFLRQQHSATIQLRASECASACSLAFLGGALRMAEPGSIGVHKSSFADSTGNTSDLVSAVQGATADVLAYLREMGVDQGLLELALRYESSDIRYLSASEMAQFRVTTDQPEAIQPAVAPSTPEPRTGVFPEYAKQPTLQVSPAGVAIPKPQAGLVRHPKGSIMILDHPSEKASPVARLFNGEEVAIRGTVGAWYDVQISGGWSGYAHSTWIKVDQFVDAGFDKKFVQIKSFARADLAAAYVRSSDLPVAAYLAANGWYAITLRNVFEDSAATTTLQAFKAAGLVPEDSFKTYGNTYIAKICCD